MVYIVQVVLVANVPAVVLKSIEKLVEFEYLMYFLMGLSDDFNHARSQVLLVDPSTAINKVFFIIINSATKTTSVYFKTYSIPHFSRPKI